MGANEVVNRNFEFRRHWQYPNVQSLSVHTKGEQVVVFKEYGGLVANNYQNTTITDFFLILIKKTLLCVSDN